MTAILISAAIAAGLFSAVINQWEHVKVIYWLKRDFRKDDTEC